MVYTKNEKADAKRRRLYVLFVLIMGILHNNKTQNDEKTISPDYVWILFDSSFVLILSQICICEITAKTQEKEEDEE